LRDTNPNVRVAAEQALGHLLRPVGKIEHPAEVTGLMLPASPWRYRESPSNTSAMTMSAAPARRGAASRSPRATTPSVVAWQDCWNPQ